LRRFFLAWNSLDFLDHRSPQRPARLLEFSMIIDKHRQPRRTHAPHGHVPNWLLLVFFVCAAAIAGLAPVLI
jgi:hypothetical protein